MDMEKLVSLCKRRGFIFPSSEIYGGINGFWDYGPLGVELKRNVKDAWWNDNIKFHNDVRALAGAPSAYEMTGIDCSIIMHPKVWEASGHVGGFSDPMSTCRECKKLLRADQISVLKFVGPWKEGPQEQFFTCLGDFEDPDNQKLITKAIDKKLSRNGKAEPQGSALVYTATKVEDRPQIPCPSCGVLGSLTEPRAFNLMFETNIGAVVEDANKSYLRPETAQGIFANFRNVVDTSRVKLPFGIGQVGKSFRNEITPRNFIFRSREFEQMEIEFFCHPDDSEAWYKYWRDTRFQWYVNHGLKSDSLRLRDHDPDELAFYSKATADIEYAFPFGVSELEGIAHRSDYDLNQHMKFSGKDLSYLDEEPLGTRQGGARLHVVQGVSQEPRGAGKARLSLSVRAARHRAVGGCGSRNAGVPVRGVHRGHRRRRGEDGDEVPPEARADQGGRVPVGQARRHA